MFGHVARLGNDTSMAHQAIVLTALLDCFLTVLGNVLHVAQEASGCVSIALTATCRPLICGDVLYVEVILE